MGEVDAPIRPIRRSAPRRAAEADSGPGTILYIAGTLPKLSETFVYREILALRERGVRVLAASVNPPEQRLGDPRLDALAAEVIPVYGSGVRRLLQDAFREVWRRPLASAGMLGMALRDAVVGEVRGGRRLKTIGQAVAGLALAQRCRDKGVGHIHAHLAHVPATIAMYAARHLGIGFSFTGHANDLFPNRALLREKLVRARFAACISHWHRRFYRSVASVPEARLPIVRCGVEAPELAERRTDREFTVVAVGRLISKKGFDVLLEAIARVVAMNPAMGLRCRIIGEGPERSRLEAIIGERGLEQVVELAGAMPNQDVLAQLEQADLCVLPCRVDEEGDRDGIPVVLMEAMARGVCIISGDLPAIRELVKHGETGLLVPPGDAAALASAMQTLMADAGLRRQLGEQGRAWVVEEFAADVNIDRLLAAFAAAGKDAEICVG